MKISCDQPRMTVWPDSTTRERPLRMRASLPFETGVDDADERADDEDPEQRDGEHPEQEAERPASPPIVPGSSVRIRLFQSRSDIVVPPLTKPHRHSQDRNDERDDDDPDRRDDEQTGDQRDGPAGHEVVEAVAEAFSQRRLASPMPPFWDTLDRRTRG